MRLAVISDVHADLEALRAALAQIERLRCDLVVCTGDLVGYGLLPEQTIALLRERKTVCVRGNHDRRAIGRGRPEALFEAGGAEPHDASGLGLSRAALAFLAGLPTGWHAVIEGVRVAVYHGAPRSDMEYIHPDHTPDSSLRRYLDQADADILICGHTHIPFVISLSGNRVVANPGTLMGTSLGAAVLINPVTVIGGNAGAVVADNPGVATSGGTFGILELPQRQFTVYAVADGRPVEAIRRFCL